MREVGSPNVLGEGTGLFQDESAHRVPRHLKCNGRATFPHHWSSSSQLTTAFAKMPSSHEAQRQELNDGKKGINHYYCTRLLFFNKKKSHGPPFSARGYSPLVPEKSKNGIVISTCWEKTRPHKEILFFCKPKPNEKTKIRESREQPFSPCSVLDPVDDKINLGGTVVYDTDEIKKKSHTRRAKNKTKKKRILGIKPSKQKAAQRKDKEQKKLKRQS